MADVLAANRYSLLPALTLKGMIHAEVIEGSFTGNRFLSFIENLLAAMDETMPCGSTIVMDNARIHKDPAIVELITSRYVEFEDLRF
jgi:hypothetical protein